MNKRKKVAWRKHRIKRKKLLLKSRQPSAPTAGRSPARGAAAKRAASS